MDQCHRHIRLSLIDLAAFAQTAHSFLPLHIRRSFSRLRSTCFDGEGSNMGSKNPSFTVHLQNAYANKGCMCIPTEFLNKHMEKKRQEVEIETVKGVWKVTLLPHKKGTRTFARFSKGWSQFARNNHFKTGQTLFFKMVRTGHRPKFVVHDHEQQNASSS